MRGGSTADVAEHVAAELADEAARIRRELEWLRGAGAAECAGDVGDLAEARQRAEEVEQRRARLQRRLDRIEETRGRMEDGSWGRCERCRQPIASERLAALPMTTRCRDHAQA